MSTASRLDRLERQLPHAGGRCPDPTITAIVGDGEPDPRPQDWPPCPACGGFHWLVLEEEVVEAAG